MILQVHDELLFEGPEAEMPKLMKLVKEVMEGVHQLRVPLVVDTKARRQLERHEVTAGSATRSGEFPPCRVVVFQCLRIFPNEEKQWIMPKAF